MHNFLEYFTDGILLAFVFLSQKIIVAIATVSFMNENMKEFLIEGKELIGFLVAVVALFKVISDFRNKRKKKDGQN